MNETYRQTPLYWHREDSLGIVQRNRLMDEMVSRQIFPLQELRLLLCIALQKVKD